MATDFSPASWKCRDCSDVFTSKKWLKTHYHSQEYSATFVNSLGENETSQLVRVEGAFSCPLCSRQFETKTSIKKHLGRNACRSTAYDGDPKTSGQSSLSPPSPLSSSALTVSRKRTLDDRILSACQLVDGSDREKKRVLMTVESLELSPFTVTDHRGIDHDALVHNTHLGRLPTDRPVTLSVDLTSLFKCPEKQQLCNVRSPLPYPGLENLFRTSPFATILNRMKFVEISKPLCDLLNEDWATRPELKYACSKLLAGCILMNTTNGHAIMVNCIELYGRKKQVDAHREPFRLIKGTTPRISIPPFGETRYDEVWPMTIASKDGDR
ncbi:hypothetical protein BGZ65_010072, partial [Modicella reniformis]